jgi:hypothetical protein
MSPIADQFDLTLGKRQHHASVVVPAGPAYGRFMFAILRRLTDEAAQGAWRDPSGPDPPEPADPIVPRPGCGAARRTGLAVSRFRPEVGGGPGRTGAAV